MASAATSTYGPLGVPNDCILCMQQWLYRRSLHTRRYKRCFVILYHNKFYCFRRNPSFRNLDSATLEKYLCDAYTMQWDLVGADVVVDSDISGGLYKWQIVTKGQNKRQNSENPEIIAALADVGVETGLANVESVFEKCTIPTPVVVAGSQSSETLWLASYNFKVAKDWVHVLSLVCKFGSVANFLTQNYSRRHFILPWYLRPLDHCPPHLKHDSSGVSNSVFGHLEICIHQINGIPLESLRRLFCIVEVNSSFYVVSLMDTIMAKYSDFGVRAGDAGLHGYDHASAGKTRTDLDGGNVDTGQTANNEYYHASNSNIVVVGCGGIGVAAVDLAPAVGKGEAAAAATSSALALANMDEHADSTSEDDDKRVDGLNGNAAGGGAAGAGDDASGGGGKRHGRCPGPTVLKVPMLKNTTQESVWFHVYTGNDSYVGSGAISDVDFSARKPPLIKACMLEHFESINPLNPKRVDLSEFSKDSTILAQANAKTNAMEQSFLLVSVVCNKTVGDVLKPVYFSYSSPTEYKQFANKASTTGAVSMLMSNVKRSRRCWKEVESLFDYFNGVFEFRDFWLSLTWLLHCIYCLYIDPDKWLLLFVLPLLLYMLKSHPGVSHWFSHLLLRFPILISLLPRRWTVNLVALPRSVCAVCAKRKFFIQANATMVENPDSLDRRVLVSVANSGKGSSGRTSVDQGPKRAILSTTSQPYITQRHVLNHVLSFSWLQGTSMERCNHRCVLYSYLGTLFFNCMGAKIIGRILKDRKNGIRLLHSIMYQPPPYSWDLLPWWLNIWYTLRCFILLLYITCVGGIDQLQMLHLLHRKRAFMRLQVENLIPDAPGSPAGSFDHLHLYSHLHQASSSAQQHPQLQQQLSHRRMARLRTLPLHWYENERRALFGTFSRHNLRVYDRPYISDDKGKAIKIPKSARRMASVALLSSRDPSGWMYAKNWNGPWLPSATLLCMVRRRMLVIDTRSGGNGRLSFMSKTHGTDLDQVSHALADAEALQYIIAPTDSNVASLEHFKSPISNISSDLVGSMGVKGDASVASGGGGDVGATKKPGPIGRLLRRMQQRRQTQGKGKKPGFFGGAFSRASNRSNSKGSVISPGDNNTEASFSKSTSLDSYKKSWLDSSSALDEMEFSGNVLVAPQDQLGLVAPCRAPCSSSSSSSSSSAAAASIGFGKTIDSSRRKYSKGARRRYKQQRAPLDTIYSESEWTTTSRLVVCDSSAAATPTHAGTEGRKLSFASRLPASVAFILFPVLLVLDVLRLVFHFVWLAIKFILAIPSLHSASAGEYTHGKSRHGSSVHYVEDGDEGDDDEDGSEEEEDGDGDDDNVLMAFRANRRLVMHCIARFYKRTNSPVSKLKYRATVALIGGVGFSITVHRRCFFTQCDRRRIYKRAKTRHGSFGHKYTKVFKGLLYKRFCQMVQRAFYMGAMVNFGFDPLVLKRDGGYSSSNESRASDDDWQPNEAGRRLIIDSDDDVDGFLPRAGARSRRRLKYAKGGNKVMVGGKVVVVVAADAAAADDGAGNDYVDGNVVGVGVGVGAGVDPLLDDVDLDDIEDDGLDKDDDDVDVDGDVDDVNDDDYDYENGEISNVAGGRGGRNRRNATRGGRGSKRRAFYSLLKRIYHDKIRRRSDAVEPGMHGSNDSDGNSMMMLMASKGLTSTSAPPPPLQQQKFMAGASSAADKGLDEPSDSDIDISHETKVGVLGLLRKVKVQLTDANSKIYLYCMRFEKLAGLTRWARRDVSWIVFIIVIFLLVATLVTSSQTLILLAILVRFVSGWRSGAWQRNVLHACKRQVDKTLAKYDIYKPLWDLNNMQLKLLVDNLSLATQVDISTSIIKESVNEWDLAHSIAKIVVATHFCKRWTRRAWWRHLYDQSARSN